MANFWKKLKKPFFVLAPMDDVTDVVFREIVASVSKPDVFFTEFVNVDGLQSKGREALLPRFKFTKNQHPIVAQIWGKIPENYYKSAKELVEMGFDGIDINMGCPERGVVKNGCCSALIDNPKLAKQIIDATKKGADGKIPVSVKTRIGVRDIKTKKWISFLLKQDLAAITIHGRTAKEMSAVPAHWDEIAKAVKLRDKLNSRTIIIGNGDVSDWHDGIQRTKEYGVDGIMIGRGIFKNIHAFSKQMPLHDEKQMLKLLLNHMKLFEQEFGNKKNFAILRKFFKVYVSGFENAGNLRSSLMSANDCEEVELIINKYLSKKVKNLPSRQSQFLENVF